MAWQVNSLDLNWKKKKERKKKNKVAHMASSCKADLSIDFKSQSDFKNLSNLYLASWKEWGKMSLHSLIWD